MGDFRMTPDGSGDFYLTSTIPLYLGDAVCALIILEDGRYLMQLRDQKADIFYPGHWGLFGGAVDRGEEPLEALYRELREELHLKVQTAQLFAQFDFDLTPMGLKRIYRMCYEVPLNYAELDRLVVLEGLKMQTFTPYEALQLPRVVPYDAFALWLHHGKSRFQIK